MPPFPLHHSLHGNRFLQCNCASRGFTYIGLLIFVAIVGLISAATVQIGSVMERREAEEQLLDIGKEFSDALTRYANATPPGQPRFPMSLQDLLKDPRYPDMRRYLRKVYADPLTGKEEWGTISPSGMPGIAGIYSLSDGKPIKIGNFEAPFQQFADKESYKEWQFMAASQTAIAPLQQ
jgi:type II secretory pathway pseudopilin PulG